MTDRIKIKVSGKTYATCSEDGCTIVNAKHYEALKDSSISWRKDGYLQIYLKNENDTFFMSLHKYIVEILENIVIPKGHIVHHKNSYRFDNDINNLEVATSSLNAAAITQPKRSCTTIYKGITFDKKYNKWHSSITYKRTNFCLKSCDNDRDAAFAYDIAYFAIHGSSTGSNNLLTNELKEKINKKREDYIPVLKSSTRILPKYITDFQGKYKVQIQGKYNIQKNFTQLEDANKFLKEFWDDVEKNKQDEIMSRPIIRNDHGIAIIPVKDKNNNEIKYALVDDSDYYKVISKKWKLDENGYAISHDRENRMHRFIMGCISHDGKKVDHINHNRLDNRKSINLRYATHSFNARNTTNHEGTSSQYVGVSWCKQNKRWRAGISINKKAIYIGFFDSEKAAHEAYQNVYKKLEKEETSYHESITVDHEEFTDPIIEDIDLKYKVKVKHRGLSSKFAGVDWNKAKSRWRARISIDKKVKSLGYFTTEDEAAFAYQQAYDKLENKGTILDNYLREEQLKRSSGGGRGTG
jgi:hypothetical protein